MSTTHHRKRVSWIIISLIHCLVGSWVIESLFNSPIHWRIGSWLINSLLVHSFINSLKHRFIASLIHRFNLVHSFSDCFAESSVHRIIGSLTHRLITATLIHRLTDSLLRCFIYLPIYSLIGSWIHRLDLSIDDCDYWLLIHRFIAWLIHWFIGSLLRWFTIHWFVGSLVRCNHLSGISATICSFVDAPHNFNTSLLFISRTSRTFKRPLISYGWQTSTSSRARHYLVLTACCGW